MRLFAQSTDIILSIFCKTVKREASIKESEEAREGWASYWKAQHTVRSVEHASASCSCWTISVEVQFIINIFFLRLEMVKCDGLLPSRLIISGSMRRRALMNQ